MLFFRFKSASTVLRAPSDSPCKNRIAHIVLEQNSWNRFPGPLCDSLSSAHAWLPVFATRENTPRLDPGVCDCGSRVYGELSASPSQWSEVASESAVFLFNLDSRSRCFRARRPGAPRTRSFSLQSGGARRGDKRNWLMLGMWSFIADTSLFGPFPAPAAGISTGRSDAVSSPSSTKWSSRISCMSGVWSRAGAKKTKPFKEVTRSCARSLAPAGSGRTVAMTGEAVAGPSGAEHSSDSRAMEFIEVTADIEDLESVTAIPKGVHRTRARWAAFTHSFVDPGCWEGRKMRCEWRDMKTVYSWLHGRRTFTFEVASCRRTGREKDCETFGSKWGRGNDKPSFRPQYSLTWNDLLVSSLLSKSVGPRPLQSCAVRALLFLEKRDASRSSSGPTLHEARTPMGARAGSSRICFTGQPFRALHQKPMRSPPISQPYRSTDRAGFGPGQVQKRMLTERETWCKPRNGVNGSATHPSPHHRQQIRKGKVPAAGQPRLRAAFSTQPSQMPRNCHCDAREGSVAKDLMTLLMEYRIWQQHLLHHCGHLRTSRRVATIVARLHDEVKSENFPNDGLDDNLQKRSRATMKHAGQAEQQGQGGKSKNQGRRGIQRLGRGLHDSGPGQLRDRARFPPNQSGWSVFFALISFFSRGESSQKLSARSSPQLAPSQSMAASDPDACQLAPSVRFDRHEARAWIVALKSWCLVRLRNGRVGPPDEIITRVHAANSSSSGFQGRQARPQQSSNVRCAQRCIYRRSRICWLYLKDKRKSHHLRSHQVPRLHCNFTIARLASCTRSTRLFANLRTPTRMVGDAHTILLCKFACISPLFSLDPT